MKWQYKKSSWPRVEAELSRITVSDGIFLIEVEFFYKAFFFFLRTPRREFSSFSYDKQIRIKFHFTENEIRKNSGLVGEIKKENKGSPELSGKINNSNVSPAFIYKKHLKNLISFRNNVGAGTKAGNKMKLKTYFRWITVRDNDYDRAGSPFCFSALLM